MSLIEVAQRLTSDISKLTVETSLFPIGMVEQLSMELDLKIVQPVFACPTNPDFETVEAINKLSKYSIHNYSPPTSRQHC